jgi:hypothetical protein
MKHLHLHGDFKIEYIAKYGISTNDYNLKQMEHNEEPSYNPNRWN